MKVSLRRMGIRTENLMRMVRVRVNLKKRVKVKGNLNSKDLSLVN